LPIIMPPHLPAPAHILVIDDAADLLSLLQRYLGDQGFSVTVKANALDLVQSMKKQHFDLLVLDLMMPLESGLSICQRLRALGETIPIIMLTAKGDPVDRIIGLESGADDYLAKPFTPRELVARIMAQLRRRDMHRSEAIAALQPSLEFGPYRLDFNARELTRAGERVALSSVEFLVLRALALHPNQELSRDRLIDLSKGVDALATDRSIDVQVMRLRRAIEDDPSSPRWIKTVRGVGYVFVPNARL
jgi:two-component system phosphate regulon response regulator OmpR